MCMYDSHAFPQAYTKIDVDTYVQESYTYLQAYIHIHTHTAARSCARRLHEEVTVTTLCTVIVRYENKVPNWCQIRGKFFGWKGEFCSSTCAWSFPQGFDVCRHVSIMYVSMVLFMYVDTASTFPSYRGACKCCMLFLIYIYIYIYLYIYGVFSVHI